MSDHNALQLIQGNGGVVKVLEELLERAKRGEITGVAVGAIIEGENKDIGWVHVWSPNAAFPWSRLVGAVNRVLQDLLAI